MSPPVLTLIHFLHPLLLSLPLPFTLTPSSSPSPDLPGVTPITVQKITPRRALILSLLALLGVTASVDVGILVGDIISARTRYGDNLPPHLKGQELVSSIVYALGGLVVWGVALFGTAWRHKFGKALVVMGMLGVVVEAVNLVYSVKREIHARGLERLFSILSIVPSSSRLLLLPTLLVALSSPRVSFEPAHERTRLISDSTDATSGLLDPGTAATSEYGTFAPASGGATPLPQNQLTEQQQREAEEERLRQKKIKINKKLGSKREPKKVLSWEEGWPKFKKLVPTLWPSTSKRLQFYVMVTSGFILLERFLNPLGPITLGWLVQSLSSWQYRVDVWKALGAYLFVRMINNYGFLNVAEKYFWIPVVQYTDREMQMLCFNHLLDLSLSYHTKRNTGEVMRIIDRGSAINELLRTVLFEVVPTLADTVIGFTVFIWLFGPGITFSVLAIMVPYSIFSFYATKHSQKLRRDYVDTDVRQRGIVSDVLTNWESVKYFTSEQREVGRFEEAVTDVMRIDYQWRMRVYVINALQGLLLVLAFAVGAILLALKIMRGESGSADFVVYITYFSQFTQPLNQLSSLYKNISSDIIDAEKMLNLLGEKTEIKDASDATELVVTDGVIEFDNVTFSYDGTKDAIRNVSFKLEKGQSLALVGETGSGKSTILRLLYRFYDIKSGHIYIDGQDITTVTQTSLRQAIGIVPQDSVLWNDTIGANIAYGRPDATDEEIIAAAQAGRIHDKIMTFEEGYDTVVGERGVRLSGGEKQRVSLSRMFLKSPAILVLDEATSALDTETEREIQKSLAKLAKGRTSLSIAHRLSTIINSDKIMVLKSGELVEIGPYKELIEKDGAFARMWKRQIYTEAELLEGDAIDKFASALPTAEDFKRYRAEKHTEQKPESGSPSVIESTNDKSSEAPMVEGASIKDVEPVVQHEDTAQKDQMEDGKGYEVDVPAPIADDPDNVTFAEVAKAAEETGAEYTPADEPAEAPVKDAPEVGATAEPETNLINLNDPTPAEETIAPEPTAVPGSSGSATVPLPGVSSPASPKIVPFPSGPRPVSYPGPSGTPSHRLSTFSAHSNLTSATHHAPPSPAKSDAVSAAESNRSGSATPSDKGDKRRKRLSSIKGFVRRISDQGGITRSPSGLSSLKSPRAERERTMSIGEGDEPNEASSLLAHVQGRDQAPTTTEVPKAEPAPPKPISTHAKKEKKKKKGKHH